MVQFKFHNLSTAILLYISIQSALSCRYDHYKYKGSLNPANYKWLKKRKIFVDPGHGGYGKDDRFRIGRNNITEEAVNLRVGLILEDLLKSAGAVVHMSRREDIKVSLDERVMMAAEFRPELLVSIHHNGSARKDDPVNYPFVFIWGSRYIRPASYDFASYLQKEFNRIMEKKGKVLSDFSVYRETGTRILRETRYLCPGALGEAGFFTDPVHSIKLKDIQYNQLEAEAYFLAISKYFLNGAPDAQVLVSGKVDNMGPSVNLIREKRPWIALRLLSGNEKKAILPGSLFVTLDGIAIGAEKKFDEVYLLNYGRELYPGGHSLRFGFKNLRYQSSMIFSAPVTVEIMKGDYEKLLKKGKYYIRSGYNIREGLKMLLSAYSMEKTGINADTLLLNIASGFYKIGDYANAEYNYKKIYYFYPESRVLGRKARIIKKFNSYRFPVDYYGKRVKVIGNINIKEYSNVSKEFTFEEWINIEIKKNIKHYNVELYQR